MTAAAYVKTDVLIATQEVAERLKDPNPRLVEVDVDTAAYNSGHVAGAVGWNWKTDLQRQPVRDIPTQEDWAALLGRSGIANDTAVVLYGDNNNWFAAFAYWLFKLYGHADARLMNGGRKKWLDEVPHDRALFLICRTGSRSRRAAQFLTQIGYDRVTNIEVVPQPGARLASPLPNNVA